jgi:hypothetical protein
LKGEAPVIAVLRLTVGSSPSNSCLDEVLIPDFGISTRLPVGQTTTVEFTPGSAGEYAFTLRDGSVSDDADFEHLDVVNVRGNGLRRDDARVRAIARLVNRLVDEV